MQEAIDLHKITTGLDGVLHPHDSIAQEHVEEVLQEKKMRSASFEVDQTFLFNSLGLYLDDTTSVVGVSLKQNGNLVFQVSGEDEGLPASDQFPLCHVILKRIEARFEEIK